MDKISCEYTTADGTLDLGGSAGILNIYDFLSEGATFTVFKGRLTTEKNKNRPVAVKVLHLCAEPRIREEFINKEEQLYRTIKLIEPRHAIHFPTVYGNIYEVKHKYLVKQLGSVVEYLEGGTLEALNSVFNDTRMHEKFEGTFQKRNLEMLIEIAEGLGAMHRAGVIHCDLKPGNIMLREYYDKKTKGIVIIDIGFGINKYVMTDYEQTFGTPEFMSPEQGKNSSLITAKTDVYALARTAHEMIVGRLPEDTEKSKSNNPSELKRVWFENVERIKTRQFVPTGLHTLIDDLLRRATLQNPEERPTAEQFSLELQQIYSQIFGKTYVPEYKRRLFPLWKRAFNAIFC